MPTKTMTKRLTRIGLLSASLISLVCGVAGCGWTHGMIFQPPPPSYGVKDIHLIRRKNYQVAMKHLPNPGARYTILYSHGNAEDLGHTLPLMRAFRAAGFAVVSYDYPGYGCSKDYTGGPTEKGAYRNATVAYRYVTTKLRVSPSRLILVGRSVGSGPATYLAEEFDAAGLVLISPFVSAYRVVTKYPLLPFDKFKNLSRIDNVEEPLLVIHGAADRVIPCWHGKKIYTCAHGVKHGVWLDGVGHNDLFAKSAQTVMNEMRAFAKRLSNQPPITRRK